MFDTGHGVLEVDRRPTLIHGITPLIILYYII